MLQAEVRNALGPSAAIPRPKARDSLGPSTHAAPFAIASSPMAAPTRLMRSKSKVDPRPDAQGKHDAAERRQDFSLYTHIKQA